MHWITGLTLFLAGIGVGILIHYWGWNKTAEIKKMMREYNRLNKEHRELQTSVDDYFSKTNRLMGDLHQSYDAVQDHFQAGVETLGKRAALQNQLESLQSTDTSPNPQSEPDKSEQPAPPTIDDSEQDKTAPAQPKAASLASDEAETTQTNEVSPPKDYAPKNGREIQGTLSEEFGLKGT